MKPLLTCLLLMALAGAGLAQERPLRPQRSQVDKAFEQAEARFFDIQEHFEERLGACKTEECRHALRFAYAEARDKYNGMMLAEFEANLPTGLIRKQTPQAEKVLSTLTAKMLKLTDGSLKVVIEAQLDGPHGLEVADPGDLGVKPLWDALARDKRLTRPDHDRRSEVIDLLDRIGPELVGICLTSPDKIVRDRASREMGGLAALLGELLSK